MGRIVGVWRGDEDMSGEMEKNKKSFQHAYQLDVYQRLFRLSKVVILKVIPRLPPEERYDLCDQLRRASKASAAILSEGFPKRFQARHWDKYITDAIGECEEMITHLLHTKELYPNYVNAESVQKLINEYEHAIGQLQALSKAWKKINRPHHHKSSYPHNT
jgi:four helix bundle protein